MWFITFIDFCLNFLKVENPSTQEVEAEVFRFKTSWATQQDFVSKNKQKRERLSFG
jgi:hypothetical protein